MESLAQTEADMRLAVFCVCPPGARFCGHPKHVRQPSSRDLLFAMYSCQYALGGLLRVPAGCSSVFTNCSVEG